MNNLTSKPKINTILIKDVEGFTFITEDNTTGFGLIDINLDLERIITIVEIDECNNKTFFSRAITKNSYWTPNDSIISLVEYYLATSVKILKPYKYAKKIPIMVDIDME